MSVTSQGSAISMLGHVVCMSREAGRHFLHAPHDREISTMLPWKTFPGTVGMK